MKQKAETVHKAVELAGKLRRVFVATADTSGLPHVTVAGEMALTAQGHVTVGAWFCPGTVENLQHNRRIALVVWDEGEDTGYQLLGEAKEVRELSFMDGYAPETESRISPQVERQLIVRVDKTPGFSHAPHSDVEE
jgi:hypothetical protein